MSEPEKKKLIGIISPCFNEEKNVELLYTRIKEVFEGLPQYDWELTYIDNSSSDQTIEILRRLAKADKRVRAIINVRNFGPARSPYYALLQARGAAVVCMACDLQDPPELIPKFLALWEKGDKFVAAVKTSSMENPLVYFLRTLYYKALRSMSNIELVEHFTGFGLLDRTIVDELRKMNDRYPYVRGMISELGYTPAKVPFEQPLRKHGKSHMRLYDLYDLSMLGVTTQSIVPLRIATFLGMIMAILSFLVAFFYLIYKLIYWHSFVVGLPTLIIGIFGIFSIQLMLIGLLGEYIGATNMQIRYRPYVVERERLNFTTEGGEAE